MSSITKFKFLRNKILNLLTTEVDIFRYEAMLTWLTQVFGSAGPMSDVEAAATMTFFPCILSQFFFFFFHVILAFNFIYLSAHFV